MILYFSATGNSKYCAEYIASRTSDSIVSLNDMMKNGVHSLNCESSERLGVIAPVYDWDFAYAVPAAHFVAGEFLDTLTPYSVSKSKKGDYRRGIL